ARAERQCAHLFLDGKSCEGCTHAKARLCSNRRGAPRPPSRASRSTEPGATLIADIELGNLRERITRFQFVAPSRWDVEPLPRAQRPRMRNSIGRHDV